MCRGRQYAIVNLTRKRHLDEQRVGCRKTRVAMLPRMILLMTVKALPTLRILKMPNLIKA
jgi:hypothetical protein